MSHGSRSAVYGRYGKRFQRQHYTVRQGMQSRRSSFFSIFVSNLSSRVPKEALRDIFSAFGVVRDVYIQKHFKGQRTYAFIRFQSVAEMRRAIKFGNRRRIDGVIIYVKEAFGVQSRDGPSDQGKPFYRRPRLINRGSFRDGRLYNEVVLSAGDRHSNALKLNGNLEAYQSSEVVPEPKEEVVPDSLEAEQDGRQIQMVQKLPDELTKLISFGPRSNTVPAREDLTSSEQLGEGVNGRKVRMQPDEFSWTMSSGLRGNPAQERNDLSSLEQAGAVMLVPKVYLPNTMLSVEEVEQREFIGCRDSGDCVLKGPGSDLSPLELAGCETARLQGSTPTILLLATEDGQRENTDSGSGRSSFRLDEVGLHSGGSIGQEGFMESICGQRDCVGRDETLPNGPGDVELEKGLSSHDVPNGPCDKGLAVGLIFKQPSNEKLFHDGTNDDLGPVTDSQTPKKALKLVPLEDLVGRASPSISASQSKFEAAHRLKKGKSSDFCSRTYKISDPTDLDDFILSDEDIAFHNKILREAESTWEVSSQLGIVFKLHREAMLEHFTGLEKEKRVSRGGEL